MNCTEKYSNPPVESYKWASLTKEVQILDINSPFNQFEYNDTTLDNILIICNASNDKYYSLAYFKIFKAKSKNFSEF